mmetsp:Transcript_173/g.379  ORF Transcript_173/g.379 Transcript_173/m.379 type:complete len:199 (-) Transcript_173:211-807(-)
MVFVLICGCFGGAVFDVVSSGFSRWRLPLLTHRGIVRGLFFFFLLFFRYPVACKASGHDIRVKFKNTHETAQAIKGMALKDAQAYLEKVMKKEDIIPFRRYRYGVGRKAQCKKYKVCNGRWPVKSCEFLLSLLKNAEGNATVNELNPDEMFIEHVQVNKAMQGRRRTYRAHGRINAFMNHPCHVEMWLTQREVRLNTS